MMSTPRSPCVHCGKDPDKTDEQSAIEVIAKKMFHAKGLLEFRSQESTLFKALEEAIYANTTEAAKLIAGCRAVKACRDANIPF